MLKFILSLTLLAQLCTTFATRCITQNRAVSGPRSGSHDDAESRAMCDSNEVLSGCGYHSPWAKPDGSRPHTGYCSAYNGNGGSGTYARAICIPDEDVLDWTTVEGSRSGTRDDDVSDATCPSGYILTGCGCYSPWASCDGAYPLENSRICRAKNNNGGNGVYAQAICVKKDDVDESDMTVVVGSESGSNDDDPSYASCGNDEILTGCDCYSPWASCDGSEVDGNTCIARNKNGGSGVFAYAICYPSCGDVSYLHVDFEIDRVSILSEAPNIAFSTDFENLYSPVDQTETVSWEKTLTTTSSFSQTSGVSVSSGVTVSSSISGGFSGIFEASVGLEYTESTTTDESLTTGTDVTSSRTLSFETTVTVPAFHNMEYESTYTEAEIEIPYTGYIVYESGDTTPIEGIWTGVDVGSVRSTTRATSHPSCADYGCDYDPYCDWTDNRHDTCSQYELNNLCDDLTYVAAREVDGVDATEACCACGGGDAIVTNLLEREESPRRIR